MLLVIDVGNTNFVLGLYKKEKLVNSQNPEWKDLMIEWNKD